MAYTAEEERFLEDPFAGCDESDVKCRTVQIRTAAKDHTCWGLSGAQDHKILKGSRYRYEKALVDDQWGEYRMCLGCMEKFLAGNF